MKIERTDDPRIVYVHDVFTKEECRKIIELSESVGFNEPGRVVLEDGSDNVVSLRNRRCHEIWLFRNPEFKELEQRLLERYQCLAELYRKNVASVHGHLVAEPTRVVRYRPDGYFRIHTDLRHCREDEWRQLTVIIHLNYCSGGQVFFPEQEVTCHTNPGSALIFPVSDNYLHEAFPPESDNKYILLCWMAAHEDIVADSAELITIKEDSNAAA
ncbi:2OG-Fe(II) oxygenase [Microbulbifer sp. THAF38]|uniref:2OG-Fe(II) oxygenase n=1 Tax=Microbulbifer sp. THAF38 TaxID=2587856 RepID=UPI0012697A9A|nr:2OG-Fe(II) oxygenase [Microbulbifer sp. THAF38]QFT56598.1 hypothetical protein FIU95_18785 [Microbulbifer sp. THAF38]